MRLDDFIEELQTLKEQHGGHIPVFVLDEMDDPAEAQADYINDQSSRPHVEIHPV